MGATNYVFDSPISEQVIQSQTVDHVDCDGGRFDYMNAISEGVVPVQDSVVDHGDIQSPDVISEVSDGVAEEAVAPRRGTRTKRQPVWMENYVK